MTNRDLRLVGRSNLERVREALDDASHRVVTLWGPGGVGKTTLAREATGSQTPFVELDVCRTVTDIASAVGEELGLPETRRSVESVGEALPDGLVVLDNAEHLVDEVADVLRDWMSAGTTRFLVTSREQLMLPAERPVEITPLSAADALRLFEIRARKRAPGFVVDESNREDVERLVKRVDGLPLAIELAAARTRILTPEQIRERLDERYELLRDEQPERPARHRTLTACIEWSWELLDEPERHVLTSCAVFRGRFNLEEAERVVAVDGWVGDILESLVEKSLVEVERGPEIRFALYDSVRRFVERNSSPQPDVVRQYSEHLREKNRRGRLSHGDLVNTMHAFELALEVDTELAIDLLIETRTRLLRGGFRDRLFEMIERAEEVDGISPVQKARLRRAEATIHYARMDYEACEEALNRSEALVDGVESKAADNVRTEVALMRAIRANESYDLEGAAELLDEALAGLDSMPANRRVHILSAAGLAAMRRRELDLSSRYFAQAVSAARECPDIALHGRTMGWSALVQMALGNLERATSLLHEALELLQEAEDVVSEAQTRSMLALSWVTRDPQRARELGRLALDAGRRAGIGAIETTSQVLLARLDDSEDAVQIMRRALRRFSSDSRHSDRWSIQLTIAVTLARRGELDRAIDEMQRMRQNSRGLGLDRQPHLAATYEAVFHALKGDLEQAREIAPEPEFARAMDAAHEQGAVPPEQLERFDDPYQRYMYDFVPLPLELYDELLEDGPGRRPLIVHEDDERVEVDGREVDLENRYVLQRLFYAMCDALEERPGDVISLDELLEAGWPDEEMTYDSGIRRVYSAIRNLRKLGFEDVILTGEGGYYIDPDFHLLRE